jgi:hypothetical protein
MSITCNGCMDTVRTPDTAWYAGTIFSYTVNYVCGTCVSLIPVPERTPVNELQQFSISFGHLICDIGSYGKYQGSGSKQAKIIFKASAKTIINNLPFGKMFLDELYPYYCIDEYIAEIMKTYNETKTTDPKARENLVNIVKAYGPPIAAWLGITVTQGADYNKKEKDGKTSYCMELKITEQEIEEVVKGLERKYR